MIPGFFRLVATPTVSPNTCGLRFDRLDGPLVVVCGLHGGAGTSTLAHALARQAARESPRPVLLAETDASAGDQAALTGVVSPLGLSELALEFAAGRRATPFVEADGLRVITGEPGAPFNSDVTGLLRAAKVGHGLVVVDAGQARSSSALALLGIASHVIWMTTVRPGAAAQGRALMATVGMLPARQALVARALSKDTMRSSNGADNAGSPTKDLRELAESYCERLVLAPDSLDESRMATTLTALAGFLAGEA